MAHQSDRKFLSLTFLGTLVGIACCVVAPVDYLVYWIDHPSEGFLITRLITYAGLGMAVGAVAEARRARRRRDPD